MKKILLISNTIYPFFEGGYERRYFEIARRLASRGFEVTVLTASPRDYMIGKLKINNVKYFSTFFKGSTRDLGREIIFNLYLTKRLLGQELRQNYDIIDINQTPPIHIPPASMMSLFKGVPVLCTIHEELTQYLRLYVKLQNNLLLRSSTPFIIGLYKFIIKYFCNHYIVVSKAVKEEFIKNLNLSERKISVIPNGIDLTQIEKFKKMSKSIYKDANIILTFIGRFVLEKRPNWAVKITNDLVKLGIKDFKIKIIGKGFLVSKLKELIDKFKVNKYVELHVGISDEMKYLILGNTDIFILPSMREGFSIATLEAMAFGAVPVVTCINKSYSGICGFQEYLIDGYNGFITTSYNEFFKYIYELINDNNKLRFMSKNAEDTAKKYDWEKIIDNLLQVYNKVIINAP